MGEYTYRCESHRQEYELRMNVQLVKQSIWATQSVIAYRDPTQSFHASSQAS